MNKVDDLWVWMNGEDGGWNPVDRADRTWLNPLGMTMNAWMLAVALKTVGVCLVDPIVLGLCKLVNVHKLPSRDPVPISKGLERLGFWDYAFLAINQVIETIGMMYFAEWGLFHPVVKREIGDLTFGNTVLFIYLVFLIDDFFYYWAHRWMHHPALYPYIHKHHHRQSMPRRGYFDAANESPLEQFIGLGAVFLTFKLVAQYSPFGAHALSIIPFMLIYAVTAFLNHTEYDVQFGILGLGYTVRAHEMHHRFPNCNYAQNTMVWDMLLGTYVDYKGQPNSKKTT